MILCQQYYTGSELEIDDSVKTLQNTWVSSQVGKFAFETPQNINKI